MCIWEAASCEYGETQKKQFAQIPPSCANAERKPLSPPLNTYSGSKDNTIQALANSKVFGE